MQIKKSRYKAHLFICNKSRTDGRKSCGHEVDPDLKTILKNEIRERGWKLFVRVSDCGCLGVCDAGPNIMIYPQKIWLSAVTRDDIPEILHILEEIMEA
ncbi:(2Fe-2S) ferredoxin domain-containing protein [Pontiella agarivorans]|uniref:(2Fe-2S) ferredoxin domain-containing protein n=1 Tax=Pontiella agarivorans TaxID=3038953 RepID=A0ABU5MYI0_9BACT|nr:(2Fe-2S) ferredoxin domain-containing protein [Pontiella agarivorans]MDZ8119274.1 (2Fe-2S) ferredoxin domain-containing protein [Pontiella agarivorans]